MRYFAYGSNMLEGRLRRRAPSAAFTGVGLLRGHRLRFNKRGRDGSGKCNIEPTERCEDLVYGVVFALDESDLPGLDRAEDALRGGYERLTLRVEVGGAASSAESYVAAPSFVDGSLDPFDWYRALVLAGALEHALPAPYRDALSAVRSTRDPDRRRRERGLEMLGRFRSRFAADRRNAG